MLTTPDKIKVNLSEQHWDKTFQLMSWWQRDKVMAAQVMVVGAGALGNEVLKNLALLGIGHTFIVDFDRIEYSNLSRSVLFREEDSKTARHKAAVAAERMRQINPNIKTKAVNGDITIDIGLGIYRRMDVIIGCLDNRLARLAINRQAFWMNKTWIDGAIENLAGQLNVYRPGVACYESGLSPTDWQNIKQRMGCADVAQRNASIGRIPTTPLAASIIGAMQVQEALKVVNGNDNKLLLGKTFYYEGMNNEILVFENTPPSEDASSSFEYNPILEMSELSHKTTVKEALRLLGEKLHTDSPVIKLNHRVVLEIISTQRDERIPMLRAFPHLSSEFLAQFQISPDDRIIVTDLGQTDEISKDFPHQNARLSDLGIPALDVLKIFANEDLYFVELSGDLMYLTYT